MRVFVWLEKRAEEGTAFFPTEHELLPCDSSWDIDERLPGYWVAPFNCAVRAELRRGSWACCAAGLHVTSTLSDGCVLCERGFRAGAAAGRSLCLARAGAV